MKSIIYNPLITQYKPPSTPNFKPEGYRPQYNWKEPASSSTSSESTPETPSQDSAPTETWINPQGTTLITDLNDPAYKQSTSHIFKDPSIDVGNMQELLDKFADAGISLRITSGYRPGAHTSSGNQSWHSQGYALDITPGANETWDSLRSKLKNSPELIKYMQDNGYGIIDETTPEMQSRTGATGPHWHIGKDQLAISGLQTLLAKSGIKVPSFRSGRKLAKQHSRVTERLYDIAEQSRQYKQESSQPTIRSEEPLQQVSIASFLPGTGDVSEIGSIINDASSGNIGAALLGASLFVIPGNIPTILKNFKRPAAGTTRLYRANPHDPRFNANRAANGEAQQQYAGQWFTSDPEKTGWYGWQYLKGKNAAQSSDLQYVDIPTSELEKYHASNVLPKNWDYEPEDFIVPESIQRTTFPSGIQKTDNIFQVRDKVNAAFNPIEIKTYLIDCLDKETLTRLGIPEAINGKPIKEVLNEIPIEIGDAAHKGGALYDASLNKIIIDKNLPIDMYGEAIDHELLHALDYLSKNNIQRYSGDVPIVVGSKGLYQKTIGDDDIFTSELAAKLVQLKNKAGLSQNQNLTGNQWKDLVQNYSSDPQYNGISRLLDQVKDWDKLADWAQKAVPAFVPILTIPSFINNGNDKKKMNVER